MMQKFRHLEPFRRGLRVWQTDRRTDSPIAYTALHYVKNVKLDAECENYITIIVVDGREVQNW